MRPTTLLVTGLLVALAIGGTAEAAQKLTGPQAKLHVKKAMKREFGNSYRHGYAKKIGCKRLSRVRMRCKTSWVIGDLYFKGHVTIWYRGPKAFYRFRIKRINEYCLATGGSKKQCTKVFK